MKRTVRSACAVLSLAFLLPMLSGCFMLPQEEAILAPPLVEPQQIEYKTEMVGRGDIVNRMQVSAYFKSSSYHALSFSVGGGRIQAIHAKLGQEVKAGDVLIELDSESVRKKIRDQKISLEKLQNNIDNLESQQTDEYAIRSAEIDLENAQNKLADLEMELLTLQVRYYDNKEISLKQQIMDMEPKVRDQKLVVEKSEIALAKLQVVDNAYAITQAKLDLEAARNTMSDLEKELENTRLRSPIDGSVSWLRDINVGDTVTAYTQMVSISDPQALVLQFDDSGNTRASQLPVGLEVTIVIDKQEYQGVVLSNPASNPLDESGSRQQYARFEVYDFDLTTVASGTNAQVYATLDSREDVIVLRKNQVNNFAGRKYVNVLEDGLKVERDVSIGLETATEVEITKGLAEGELIIVN